MNKEMNDLLGAKRCNLSANSLRPHFFGHRSLSPLFYETKDKHVMEINLSKTRNIISQSSITDRDKGI